MNTANDSHKSPRKALVLCLLAVALSAAFLFESALAQEGPEYEFVDLVMLYEQGPPGNPTEVIYRVQNLGNIAATGVTISFLLEDLEITAGDVDHTIMDRKTVDDSNQTFTTDQGTILPGEVSSGQSFSTVLHSHYCPSSPCNDAPRIGSIQATASSDQPEPDLLLPNSSIKIYSYALQSGSSKHMGTNKLGLMLEVSDLRPDATGDAVDFTLTARNMQGPGAKSGSFDLIGDIEIKVELSDGLEFKSTTDWTRPTGVTTSGRSATWRADPVDKSNEPGSAAIPQFQSIVIKTQLTSDNLEAIKLEERCITAWVEDSKPPPSPDYVLNSLTECLGDDPTVVFKDREIDLLYLHPCATATTITYPCRDADGNSVADNGLELVVYALLEEQLVVRRSGVGRYDGGEPYHRSVSLRPEIVVVRVDPEARVGTKWYTGSDENSDANDAGIIPGALVHLDFLGAAWKPYTFAISDVSPKKRPGSMALLNMANTGFTILDADTKTSLGPLDSPVDVIGVVGAFGTLGTYEVNLTMGGTNGGTAYTSTGKYTFHVGPIAELEVRDGGGNEGVPAGQRAYTVVAVNNGPDAAPAAKVTLRGLDAGSCTGSATKGSVAFADNECAWTIGELMVKDLSQIAGGRDGEVLTIITSAAADTEITAAISNTQDYEVCIDSSGNDVDVADQTACTATTDNTWHTAKYYDYISDNDRASIKAKDGTGAALPSPIQTRNIQSTYVSWMPLSTLYRRVVTGYEIGRSADGGNTWVTMATVPGDTTSYVVKGQSPSLRYAVRAVNAWNHKGPWSAMYAAGAAGAPARPAGPPTNVSAERSESDPAGAIKVSWEAPLDDGGSRITGYQAQGSATGTEGWSNACAASAAERSCEHTDLGEGTTRYYRVAARTARGLGQWSAPPAAASTRPAACDIAEIASDGSPVAGSWGADCESQERAGSYARYYQFTLTESADIWVELESEDTETALYLREGAGVTSGATTPGGFNGGEPEYSNRRASIEASLAAGTYTVEAAASAAGQTGSFTLTVGVGPEGCRAEKVTADGSPVAGTWGDDCESTAREGHQARYYRLTLTESAGITVQLESEDAETVLYLREGAGNTSGATTPGGFNEGESEYNYRRASIEETLAAGTYTIEATTFAAGQTGDFTLTVSEAVGCEAVEVSADGSPVSGSWGGDCQSEETVGRNARYYKFSLDEDAEVTIELKADAAEPVLHLREGESKAGTEIAGHEGFQDEGHRRAEIVADLEAGKTYTIEARTYTEGYEGPFTLTVSGAVEAGGLPPGPCDIADVATDGSPVSGSWGADCQSEETAGRNARYYKFSLDEDAEVTIKLKADAAEPVLHLREGESKAGTEIAGHEGFQDEGHRRAEIVADLEAGKTYTIEARTYTEGYEGPFTLTVSVPGGPGPVGCGAVAVSADGSPVAGSWGGDCESTEREERQARYYQFTLAESADITVLLESDDAETVLYLREGAGNTSGATIPGGFNEGESEYNYRRASIEQTLAAGTYTIEATTYAAGETGAFSLTVSGGG